MKLTPRSLAAARRALGLPPLPDTVLARRVSLQGELAEEALAYLLIRENALADEPVLAARLAEIAAAHHVAPRTARRAVGDRTATRLHRQATARAMDEIVAMDRRLFGAEAEHAAALAPAPPDGPLAGTSCLIETFADGIAPSTPP
ncbi:MAG: hypothetical protein AAFU72_05310 [Pseudomonadota bacterium]